MDQFIYNTLLDAYDTIVKYNTVTRNLFFVKSELIEAPLNTTINVNQFLQTYHKGQNIHPDDLYMFEIYFSPQAMMQKAISKENGLLFSYRSLIDDSYMWSSIYLYLPNDYSEDNPQVLICRKMITQRNADLMEMMEFRNKKIYKVVKCNLSDNSFRVIKQREAEDYIRRKYTKDHRLHEEWLIEEGLIHPDDIDRFEHYTDHDFIIRHFQAGREELNFFYRRKIGNMFRWIRATIIQAYEYTEENRVFLYMLEDIDYLLLHLLDAYGQMHSPDNKTYHDNAYQMYHENAYQMYHDNLIPALNYFTQKYIDCYLIDLKKDRYITYKIRPENLTGDMPYVGSFSEMGRRYIKDYLSANQSEVLLEYASPDAFRRLLKDKMSMEFTFDHRDGRRVKTICRKIESEKGIPAKVLCFTIPWEADGLLKVQTFGNFDVFNHENERIAFSKKQSKQLLAYLIDKQGYPVSTKDIVIEVLEKDSDDKNAIKYVSKLSRLAIQDLKEAGYEDIIIKEWNSLRVNVEKLDCDYYHLINGDNSYWHLYHNEYMKEYSWAEETNAELLHYSNI